MHIQLAAVPHPPFNVYLQQRLHVAVHLQGVKKELSKTFKMKVVESLHHFLGVTR